MKAFNEFIIFTDHFLRYAYYLRGVLVSLLILIFLGGLAISYLEELQFGESIYFACITGLSIGYGDISPVTTLGRGVSVGIGAIGMLTTGVTVAVATRALAATVKDIQSDQ